MELTKTHKSLLNACALAIVDGNDELTIDLSPFNKGVKYFGSPDERNRQILDYLDRQVDSRSGRKRTIRYADAELFAEQLDGDCLYLAVCFTGARQDTVSKVTNGMVLLRLSFSKDGFMLGAMPAPPGLAEGRIQHREWLEDEAERERLEAEEEAARLEAEIKATRLAEDAAQVAQAEADVARLASLIAKFLRGAVEFHDDPLVREAVNALLPEDTDPDMISVARAAREMKGHVIVFANMAIAESNNLEGLAVE